MLRFINQRRELTTLRGSLPNVRAASDYDVVMAAIKYIENLQSQVAHHPNNTAVHPTKPTLHPKNFAVHPTNRALHPTNLSVHPTNPAAHPTNPGVHQDNPTVHSTNNMVHPTNNAVHQTNVSLHPTHLPVQTKLASPILSAAYTRNKNPTSLMHPTIRGVPHHKIIPPGPDNTHHNSNQANTDHNNAAVNHKAAPATHTNGVIGRENNASVNQEHTNLNMQNQNANATTNLSPMFNLGPKSDLQPRRPDVVGPRPNHLSPPQLLHYNNAVNREKIETNNN